MYNEPFGWLWIALGLAAGAVIGVWAEGEDWLGGYGHRRRRLVRLAHISFVMLGLINILFSMSLQRMTLPPPWRDVASWTLIIGAMTMPMSCFLTAWKRALNPVFAIPTVCLIIGTGLAAAGLFLGAAR
ncbi:MAG: hypothetical protein NTW86_31700 [Candidatus Sumerlaeota bacterium]|nr:hypothetical protein [Candidatus Sumerlaeota bacterium]